jgi:hypothetical protein
MASMKNARVMVPGGSAGHGRAIVEACSRARQRLLEIGHSYEVEQLGAQAIASNVTDAGAGFMDRIVKGRAPPVLFSTQGPVFKWGRSMCWLRAIFHQLEPGREGRASQ